MAPALALWQAEIVPGTELYIILGVITLAVLVALGLRFFVNIFEVITAPTASLRHHGQADNFFFSIFVSFLGGLLGTFGLLSKQSAMTQTFSEYATIVCNGIAQGNSNGNYQEIAAQWGIRALETNFDVYFTSNLIFFPILMVLLWLFIGSVAFIGSRIFGGRTAYGDFLGTLAYSSLFASVGLGMACNFGVQALKATAEQGSPSPDVQAIIGIVLLIYGIVLFLLGVTHGAELTTGQVIGVLVVMAFILGGAGYGIYYASSEPWETFKSSITSFNPAESSI